MKKMKKIASVCLSALMLTTSVFAVACNDKPACEHTYDLGRVTKNATCKAEGVMTYTCEKCGGTKTEPIEKSTEHTFDYTRGTETTPATCQNEGVMTYTCTVCNEATDTRPIPTTDHEVVWDNGQNDTANCTDSGVKTGTCSLGGTAHTVTEDVPATGHHYVAGVCSECDDLKSAHTWGDLNTDWVLVKEASCTEMGLKKLVAQDDNKHFYTETIAMREHKYENGVCESCQQPAEYPTAPAEITYSAPLSGNGSAYLDEGGRWECKEGYYEINLNATENWLSFSVSNIGQYALYSIENTNGVTVERYDASANYITPTPYPARVDDDGNVHSTVNCAKAYSSENDLANWRATYKVSGNVGDVIKLRFVRIADPAWTPDYIRIQQYAKQIKGVATDMGDTFAKVEVPYESAYFYDETDGYYYLGTKEARGAQIYVDIKNANRFLTDISILELLGDSNGFLLSQGQNADGDYILYDYSSMFLVSQANGNACYESNLNKHGMYPLNKELYDFLNEYVQAKGNDSTWGVTLDKAWLAPCFYYMELETGTENRPHAITDLSDTKTVNVSSYTYFNLKYGKADYESNYRSSYVTITLSDPNAYIQIGKYNYKGSVMVESSADGGVNFLVKKPGNPNEEVSVSFAEYTQGTYGNPITIQPNDNAQTLTALQFANADGEPTYMATYAYAPTSAGTAVVTLNGETKANVYVNGELLTDSVTIDVVGVTDEDTQETTYTPVQIYLELPDFKGFFVGDELYDGTVFTNENLQTVITFTFQAN